MADRRSHQDGGPEANGGYVVGVDVGGTFIDVVARDTAGRVSYAKVPSTSHVLDAIEDALAELDISLAAVRALFHGSTVATNALIEKPHDDTVLVTTKGFRDILEIRRTNKDDLFDLKWAPPTALIPRYNRIEVTERIDASGEVLIPLDEADLDRLAEIVRRRAIRSVAVVLIHSYANPEHERRVRGGLLERCPHLHVTISSDVLPFYREFERTTTTAANAYVAPVLAAYVEGFEGALAGRDAQPQLFIMQSNGGVAAPAVARDIPAKLARSGPAGGAVGLADLARRIDRPNVIGLDIGGTSADVCMVLDGEPRWQPQLTVEFGLPINFPAIDIVSIGAGGGTIAWIDKGGGLRVGPASAGSEPGPACYASGGEEPTTTDAQVVLGRLNPENFLGGKMTIEPSLAETAIDRKIAEPLGLSTVEASRGIVEIATMAMVQAVRLVTIERGYDPRDFALCAFGGSGGLYGAQIARELAMPTMVAPACPGVFSAAGMGAADLLHDASRTVLKQLDDLLPTEIEAAFSELDAQVTAMFEADGAAVDTILRTRYSDLVYSGQTHPLSIRVADGPLDDAALQQLVGGFHFEHERQYGHADHDSPLELLALRVFGRGRPLAAAAFASHEIDYLAPGRRVKPATRTVYFAEGAPLEAAVLDRVQVGVGRAIDGPAVIEQMDTTILVPPGMTARHEPATQSLVIDTNPGSPR